MFGFNKFEKGWLAVVGGFLIHLVLGTLYCWANITSSVTSRIRKYSPNTTYNDTLMVYAAALAAQGATMLLGGIIGQKIGTRYCCLVGGYILALGVYCASFSESVAYLIFTQGIMFGIGIGICYTSPISCCVRWLPNKKGLVTGIIVGGFGCGAFVFGFLAIHLVNPQKLGVASSGPNENYYSPDSDVVANVPFMFEVLSLTYLAVITAGSLLITDPTAAEIEELKQEQESLVNGDSSISAHGQAISVKNVLLQSVTGGSKYGAYRSVGSSGTDDQQYASGGVEDGDVEMMVCSVDGTCSTVKSKNDNNNMNSMDSSGSNSTGDQQHTKLKGSSSNSLSALGANNMNGDSVSNSVNTDVAEVEFTPKEVLRSPIAWHIACCLITTTVGGMYIAGTFKTFGQETFKDETFLSSISSLSSVFNALGRIFWGHMADRYGALKVLIGMAFIFSVIISTYALSPFIGEGAFALWTWLIFFFEGGNFVLYVPIVVQQFGSKHSASNYGMIFSSFSLFVVINITLLADSGLPFATTTLMMGFLTFIGFVNLLFLDRHVKIAQKQKC